MNLTYIIGMVLAILVFVLGIIGFDFNFALLGNFIDPASIFIVIGCTLAVVIACFPGSMLASIPKHFAVMLNAKKFKPMEIIDQLVELAQTARKNGLLSLEEKANEQKDLLGGLYLLNLANGIGDRVEITTPP